MDRANNRVENRDININKVVDKIGLKDKMIYDSIDVFIDKNDKDSLWAIAHYSTYLRKKKVSRDKIIKFKNYNDMIFFLQNNFDTYELNHHVDYLNRSIFIHRVDYIGMDYYLHEGRPDLNYIEIRYKDYDSDSYKIKTKQLPKEYERMLLDIIKTNKKHDPMAKLDSDFYREIDVYAKEKSFNDENNGKERISRRERRLEKEKSGMPMPIPKQNHTVRNIVIGLAVVSILATGGIALVKNSEYKKGIITHENSGISIVDFQIDSNKDRAYKIVEDLMINNYENIKEEDLDFLFKFIKKVSSSNYDSNKSSTYFNYEEYFNPIVWHNTESVKIANRSIDILHDIEEKYRNCFKVVDNVLMINQKNVKSYIDYVASLTFMYDVVVDQRNSNQAQIDMPYTGIYASKEDIETYNLFPNVLKYIILCQLEDMLYHTNYEVSVHPANYRNGKEIDRLDLINSARKEITLLEDSMKTNSHLYGKKTI